MTALIAPERSLPDRAALGWFLLAWLGYGPFIQRLRSPRSITARLRGVRRAWMHAMLGRDNRITDASLIGHAMHSATFFASTTMVALAALLGMLANLDHTQSALEALTFTAKAPRPLVEGKVLLLLLVFAHTFLKLTWAIRQLNYGVALIGAAPNKPGPALRDAVADRTAAVLSLAVGSFNAGVRGYYFALAALAWVFGPGAFALATAGMVAMLLWRQFGSATAEAIRLSHAVLAHEAPDTADRDEAIGRDAVAQGVA
jgi:uncharacterized membrane protein